jgi:hypothetical protein
MKKNDKQLVAAAALMGVNPNDTDLICKDLCDFYLSKTNTTTTRSSQSIVGFLNNTYYNRFSQLHISRAEFVEQMLINEKFVDAFNKFIDSNFDKKLKPTIAHKGGKFKVAKAKNIKRGVPVNTYYVVANPWDYNSVKVKGRSHIADAVTYLRDNNYVLCSDSDIPKTQYMIDKYLNRDYAQKSSDDFEEFPFVVFTKDEYKRWRKELKEKGHNLKSLIHETDLT